MNSLPRWGQWGHRGDRVVTGIFAVPHQFLGVSPLSPSRRTQGEQLHGIQSTSCVSGGTLGPSGSVGTVGTWEHTRNCHDLMPIVGSPQVSPRGARLWGRN